MAAPLFKIYRLKRQKGNNMQHRVDRINEEIKKALSEIFRELKDPRMHGMVSITGIKVTPDLHYAKVWISVLGKTGAIDDVMAALKSASGFIRKEVGMRVKLRCVPEFTFVADSSIADGMRMSKLIDEISSKDSQGDAQ